MERELLPGHRVAMQSLQISVVVPTCGRPHLLKRCLATLARQDLDASAYEIVVVDDRPGAATLAAVAGCAREAGVRGLRVRYVPSAGPHGPAAARNIGWRKAAAPIIAFTDDDTEPDRSWLANALRAFGPAGGARVDAPIDVVCGRVVMPIASRPTDYERDASGLARAEFVTANCLCRRGILERVNGFDERFPIAWREDSDLHFRLLECGARIVRAVDAVVVHPVRPAPWGVSLAQQRKVVFDALLFKKHRRLYRERIRRGPRWDYYLTVASLAAAPLLFAAGYPRACGAAAALWLVLTARLCAYRLRGTSKAPAHVAEMMVTSALIPPLSVAWRVVGALRFKVLFA
jgi:GT2 family glycosyltransferase